MAFASVVIDVVDKASGKLRALNAQSAKLDRSFRVLDKRNKGLSTRFNGLAKAVAAVGLLEFGRRSINTAANFQKLQLRLRLLTEATGDFSRAQAIATEGQKLFGISNAEALDGVTNITARLLPLGVSLEDIRTTFIGFNTAAKLGGASAIEASNAFRQLAQALGSGRLAGDEFRSVSEQVPLILKPLAEELGVSVGALKELAAQGRLTSDVVIRALKSIGREGGPALKAILENDPTQVFKNLQNEVENLQISIGSALLPAVKAGTEILQIFIGVINAIPPEITSFITVTGTLITSITILKPLIKSIIGTIKTLKALIVGITSTLGGPLTLLLAGLAVGVVGLTRAIKDEIEERTTLNKLIKEGTSSQLLERIEVEENTLAQLRNSNARGNAKRGIQRQIEEQKKLIALLKEEAGFKKSDEEGDFGIDTSFRANRGITIAAAEPKPLTDKKDPRLIEQNLNKEIERRIQLKQTVDETDRLILERSFEHIDQIRAIIDNESIVNKEKAISLATTEFQIDKTKILNDNLKDQDEIFKEIGDSIATGISDALVSAVEGTKSLGEAAKGVLSDISNQLLKLGINTLLKSTGLGIFENLQGFANGGKPPVGKPSLVGEKGPELFVPSGSGTIIPNKSLGGQSVVNNISVSVDASGTSVQGNDADANQFGEQLAAAIQAEIINQKRSGGLLN
tara:strand:- start:3785 stop:5842 length:2058 start_codon:yes stop_codon:yes gene_type:complete